MEERKEYAEGEPIACPKCGSDDLDCEDTPARGKCLACGLEFTIRQVAVWEETVCRLGYCAKKNIKYGGGENKDLEKGQCPICKGKLCPERR